MKPDSPRNELLISGAELQMGFDELIYGPQWWYAHEIFDTAILPTLKTVAEMQTNTAKTYMATLRIETIKPI
jgi:hypothetical protein